jgi:hypothetical protein
MSGVRALIREAAMTIREAEISCSHHAQRSHVKQIKRKKSKRERERRKLEILAKRKAVLDRLPATLKDDQVLTFSEWRVLNHISERNGRRIFTSSDGPVLTRLSANRFGVTVANNRAWQQSRQRA